MGHMPAVLGRFGIYMQSGDKERGPDDYDPALGVMFPADLEKWKTSIQLGEEVDGASRADVLIETVYNADDGEGLVILGLCPANHGQDCEAKLWHGSDQNEVLGLVMNVHQLKALRRMVEMALLAINNGDKD